MRCDLLFGDGWTSRLLADVKLYSWKLLPDFWNSM